MTVLIAWFVSNRSLANAKEALLAQQRAAVQTVGAEWFPLRDRIEALTVEAARDPFKGDFVAPEAATWDFRSIPGIYLRLRAADATSAEAIRKAAPESVKDAFTSCLLREPTAAGDGGLDAADAGVVPDQPWNLRQAYAATRVLTDTWTNEVKASEDPIRLRVFEQQYDKARREGIPLAIEIVKRAQFYLLVLDEDVPEAKEFADGGSLTSEALQQVSHPARVYVINLRNGAEIARLRRTGSGDYRFAGERAVHDPEVRAAMRRQVNNCALAEEIWGAIRPNVQQR